MGPESRDDFRVAIICALPLEADAVLNLFDQRYDKDGSKYGKQEGDTNIYSTGRIGRHDIVLVHMPGMGVCDATRVASNLRRSFGEIRLALVVGVCGGAPLERPIVLGDVVVSNSIVEFYTARYYPDGIQARKGLVDTLRRPNPEIRGLLSKFEIPLIREELEGEIQRNLAELCQKSDKAQYPGVEHDRLFAASYRHMHRKETSQHDCLCFSSQSNSNVVCNEALTSSCDVLGCDVDAPESLSRCMRFAAGVPTPLVHIGTIGATTVMKSGVHRDIMASEDNIIAFEMEGAGVWEDLPCVIIKGVCDYADSHKNKKWQGYAAATAASAAKAFLGHWASKPHNRVAAESPSTKRPLSVGDEDDAGPSKRVRRQSLPRKQSPEGTLETSSNSPLISVIGSGSRQILLDALDFEQLDTRYATIKPAHAATCEWLLSEPGFKDWQDEQKLLDHHGFLWIKGKPGAGKSTIMKFAYTNAKKDSRGPIAISYFFNARGEHLEKSTRGMYRSLLFQLLSKVPRLQVVLDTTEATHLQSTSPDLWTTDTLQSLFHQAVERLEDQHLTCFVDALDECENNDVQVREMVRFFETVGESAVKDKLRFHVCFSSRHYPHITIDKGVELTLEVQEGHSDDITKYVNSKLKVGRSKRVEQIKIDVQKKSQGIFLWVVLVIPMLQQAYDDGKVRALDECLKTIPKDLNELFHGILGRDSRNMESLVLCLRWILYAERPLKAEELYFAMLSASETGPVAEWDPDDDTPEDIGRFILSSSKGLAEPTRGKTPTIQFIHESVRDFLLNENGLAVPQVGSEFTSAGPIHDSLKEHCQHYLTSVPTGQCLESLSGTPRIFPFLDYSIRYVFKHAELAASHGTSQEGFLEQFPLEKWVLLHDLIERYRIRHYGTGTSLLYVLTERNLLHLFQIEICRSRSINAKGGRYDFPIIAAAAVGNKEMLELLLEHGADVNKSGREYRHALSAAVDKSKASAVEVLIRHDDMSSSTDDLRVGLFANLLSQAVKRRDMFVIKLLLQDRGALASKVSTKREFEDTVETVIKDGDNDIVKLLIDLRVIGPSNRRGFDHALVAATRHAKKAIVHMLLDSRRQLARNHATYSGRPLLEAVKRNHETIVRMLLKSGADVSACGEDGSTGLHIACGHGYETIVRLFLENNASVDALNSDHRTALWIASFGGHDIIVRRLLEHGADANTSDKHGRPALHIACILGHEAVVRVLLEKDACVNAFGGDNNTALGHVAFANNGTIARILLEHGAEVNKGDPLNAALDRALRASGTIMVPLLLEFGADPNQHSDSRTRDLPLHTALHRGMTNIVKLLLDHGADVNKPSRRYKNASSALDSCTKPAQRAACEVLLLKGILEQSSVPCLT